jgi:hypothetical protein
MEQFLNKSIAEFATGRFAPLAPYLTDFQTKDLTLLREDDFCKAVPQEKQLFMRVFFRSELNNVFHKACQAIELQKEKKRLDERIAGFM